MKKYKLIKTYPNSPSLGAEVEEQFFSKCNLEHENFSEFWQEIKEKDYEILSLCSSIGNISDKYKDGKVMWTTDDAPKFYSIESILSKGNHTIHSVKRLSDNEVFMIGDQVTGLKAKWDNCYITNFHLDNNDLSVEVTENTTSWRYSINKINLKKKEVLFTTEDGVDIYGGDPHYPVELKYFKLHPNAHGKMYSNSNKDKFKIFSTKEAAEKYIIENKPCLSLKDLKGAFYSIPNLKYKKSERIIEDLEVELINLVKNKL